MRIRLRYIAALLVLTGVVYAGRFAARIDAAWRAPGPLSAETLVYFPPGHGGKSVALKLASLRVIDDPFAFRVLAKVHAGKGPLKTGEYKFTPRMTMAEIIALLQSGKTYQRRLTIPEGRMSSEVEALVNAAETMTGTAMAPPEGSVLPETYAYSYGDDRPALMARMRRDMQNTLDELWPARDPAVLLSTPEEAVILASIIEKETGVATERPRVAGVFYNRLKKGIPLQSDPTVAYAVTGGKYVLDHGLRKSELQNPSPYNTYVHKGLPPGPIANPGREALKAVLHPEAHDYLYFVADGTGGHVFSVTLTEHNRNVQNWRKTERTKK